MVMVINTWTKALHETINQSNHKFNKIIIHHKFTLLLIKEKKKDLKKTQKLPPSALQTLKQ